MTHIIPVILSGGSGSRLWPLSRKVRPKQFMSFNGGLSLIQDTMLRCSGGLFDHRPILVGAFDHRFMLADAAQHIDVSADILLEPMRRDSCAAVVAGCLEAYARDPDCIVMIMAADHSIPDQKAFAACVAQAVPAAEAGYLVTFGVKPDRPATGYGYILPGEAVGIGDISVVKQFVEKPDSDTAQVYVAKGYLWNSGNFLFSVKYFLEQARLHAAPVVQAVEAALQAAVRGPDFIHLNDVAFAGAPRTSLDYAVMEKTTKACVLPVSYQWSDIGTWEAVAATLALDSGANSAIGEVSLLGAKGVTVHSEGVLTAVVGCEDIVVVSTNQAVLVLKKGHGEKVKDVVEQLERGGEGLLT